MSFGPVKWDHLIPRAPKKTAAGVSTKPSPILPRETDGLFNEDPYLEPKEVIERVYCEHENFDRLETSPFNFNCSFYSLGISRLQAANLLLRNLEDPLVRGYVGDQIFTVLSANDVHQLPGDQAPYEEIRALFRERDDLQTVFDAEAQEAFNVIEESTGVRPPSLAEAMLLRELGPVITKNLHDLQELEIAIQAKDLECRDACKTVDSLRHYICNFVAQPYKTMEFQHDQGERVTHCVLDAIAYLQGYSLNIYQRFENQNLILRHRFVHPAPRRGKKHIFHEGGGSGGVGHFERLNVVE